MDEPGARPCLCLFDLDDTLLPLDSDHAWGEFVVAPRMGGRTEFRRRNNDFYSQYKAGGLDIHAYIEFATRPLATHPAQARSAHARFMREVITPDLRAGGPRTGSSAPAPGDRVALVTSTNDFITAPIAPPWA